MMDTHKMVQSQKQSTPSKTILGKLLWFLALSALSAAPNPFASVAQAAETGTLRGQVVDADTGEALEGVVITLRGENVPGARVKNTDIRGSFWFPVLPPGDYRIGFSIDGYQTIEFEVEVVLDQTTTLPPVPLTTAEFSSDVIEVIAQLPVLDTTASAAVTNVDEEYFERIPAGRTYLSTLRTLPGVSGRINYVTGQPGGGNPSVRGEGQQGNNFLLEGFSIRDPVDKGWGISIPNEAIQELTVFTDGAPAEYGTFTGMTTNILLKSGENDIHGSLEYLYTGTLSRDTTYELYSPALASVAEIQKATGRFNNVIGTLGGALVPDKLWYFNSVTYQTGWSTDDGSDVRQELPYSFQLASRLTYNPFDSGSTLFNFTALAQRLERSNYLPSTLYAPESQLNGVTSTLNLNGNLKTLLSDYVIFEAKFNSWHNDYSAEPVSGDYQSPSYNNVDTLQTYGNAPLGLFESRNRQGVALHMTKYTFDKWGDHIIKGGYEWFLGANEEETIYTGGPGTLDNPAYSYETQGMNNDPYSRTEHYNVGRLTHGSQVNVFFLQDQWQPMVNLTLNIGARLDNERLTQADDRDLVNAWVFSPRFGMAWDVLGDQQNLISVNAGRYYDTSALSLAYWGDTRSGNYYTTCLWDEELGDYSSTDAAEGGQCVTQDPVAEPSVFTPDFKPYAVDKAVVGYQRALPGQIAFGVKGIFSRTLNLSEDVNVDDHYWEIRNPQVIKSRDYKALEFTLQRRWIDNWQLMASYTLSSARGTTPGQSEGGSSGNDVGVYLDNPSDPYVRNYYNWLVPTYGYTFFNGLGYDAFQGFGQNYAGSPEGFYGYLPYHSFHQVKVNASYEAPWGSQIGMVYEFDSGHAYEKSGYLVLYDNATFPEGRGVRTMPPVHFLDLTVGHTFYLPSDVVVEAQLNVFNVLDLEQVLSYFTNFNQQYDYLQSIGVIPEEQVVNPGWGQPYTRQGSRSIQAGLKFTF